MAGLLRERAPGVKLRGTVTFDLDGTIASSVERVLEIFSCGKGAVPLSIDKISGYGIEKLMIRDGKSITREELRSLFMEAWNSPSKMGLIDPRIPGIIDRVAEHWRVALLTSTVADRRRVEEFIEYRGIKFDAMHFVKHVEGKVEMLRANHEVLVHVDDETELAVKVAMLNRNVLLLDRPYTGVPPLMEYLFHVKDWEEVERLLRIF